MILSGFFEVGRSVVCSSLNSLSIGLPPGATAVAASLALGDGEDLTVVAANSLAS